MKRIFLAMLVMICCFSMGGCSPVERVASIENDDQIIMTVYAYDGQGESRFGLLNLGHSFLSIENKSDQSIIIGNYELPKDDIVTLSTWCVSEHFGIWYNMESNYIKYHDKYNGRYSVSIGLELDKLEAINNYIKNNDTWVPTKNCTNFSVGLWNSVCDEKEKLSTPLIYTPKKLTEDIKSFNVYEYNKDIPVSDRLGYFDSSNNFVTFAFEKALEGGI